MNYNCGTQFNVVTTLKDCNGWKKKMQESTDPFKYTMDIKPSTMCFMQGSNFQGLAVSQRQAPPALMETERFLRNAPLIEEDQENYIEDIHNAKPPTMPPQLSNRMIIPECNELLGNGSKITKIKKTEFPEWATRTDLEKRQQFNYMRPGRDTKLEIRDAYQTWDQKKNGKSVYGIGKYSSGALRPVTDVNCNNADSDNGCMHVKGPDAVTSHGKIRLDPTVTLTDMQPKVSDKGFFSQFGFPFSEKSGPSNETQNIAKSINQNVPYTQLLTPQLQRNGCNAKFYDYKPNC